MFDFLRKKLTGFVDKLTGKENEKQKKPQPEEQPFIKKEIETQKQIQPEKIPEADRQKRTLPQPQQERTTVARLGMLKQMKSLLTNEVQIEENDIRDMLDTLELELLEGDVDMGVASSIVTELRLRLVGAKVEKQKLSAFITEAVKKTLAEAMHNKAGFDIVTEVRRMEKPVRLMFLGPNGAGKTTTIAKVANMLMQNKHTVVLAAADTFRAAAIEQMAVHAERLGVRLIRREYGSDPTSVAYDAVNYAKAHGIDAVLIDTAGRQDTNINLINELKKMNRIIQPELKIYIGESIAGNAMLEQLSVFGREIGIDGVILTKLDCDPKGGVMLSVNRVAGIPVLYMGTGQKYGDIERFDAEKIAERIIGA